MTDRRIEIQAGHTDRGPGRSLLQQQTFLVHAETVVDDDAPDPAPPNRATRRAMQRATRRTK